MKCRILHESAGRMRVHMSAYRMSPHQADLLEYYLRDLAFIRDVKVYDRLLKDDPEMIVEASVEREVTGNVTDSSTRKGYFIIASDDRKKIMDYLP